MNGTRWRRMAFRIDPLEHSRILYTATGIEHGWIFVFTVYMHQQKPCPSISLHRGGGTNSSPIIPRYLNQNYFIFLLSCVLWSCFDPVLSSHMLTQKNGPVSFIVNESRWCIATGDHWWCKVFDLRLALFRWVAKCKAALGKTDSCWYAPFKPLKNTAHFFDCPLSNRNCLIGRTRRLLFFSL